MARLLALVAIVGVALLVAPSCGGGGGTRDSSLDVTFDAPPMGGWDGCTAFFQPNPVATVYSNYSTGISAGDWFQAAWNDQEVRGFFTFNIVALPAPPAVVRAASLTISVWGVTGVPLPGGTRVDIEQVNLGAAFDGQDHVASGAFIQTVTSNPGVTSYTIDVRSEVGADQIALRPRSSFRVRMTTWGNLNDGGDDTLDFNDAEDHAGSPTTIPKLTITYTP